MISPDKQYKTRCGYPVKIHTIEKEGYFPNRGAALSTFWTCYSWRENGQSVFGDEFDLIEVESKVEPLEELEKYLKSKEGEE